jgi:hypothetical protein
MALVYSDMPCSLCGDVIKEGEVYVASAHFISDDSDPLWRYSDSAMHRRCFDAWEHRGEFARRHREFWARIRPGVEDEWPESSTFVMPAAEAFERKLPEFVCLSCRRSLSISERGECPHCQWLRFPGDRSRWRKAGPCPCCGFEYRWDGSRCSHCGFGTVDLAAEPAI